MKRIFVAAAALLCCGVALAAASAYFVSASTSINSNGYLVATFKEAGLGSGSAIGYDLSADADATYACVAQGHGKKLSTYGTEVLRNVDGTATIVAGRNGRIVGGLAVAPPEPTGFSCPNGGSLQLANITYSNVELYDTTTPLQAPLTGTCAGSSGCTDVLIRQ